jgi:hypothetical protein
MHNIETSGIPLNLQVERFQTHHTLKNGVLNGIFSLFQIV